MRTRFPSPMIFRIRRYSAGDFEKLHAIDQLCYSAAVAYTHAEMRWHFGLDGAECFIAEVRNARSNCAKVAGFVLTVTRNVHGHIITMDVAEMYRRRGAASLLLKRAEEEMEKRGALEVWLETAIENRGAIAFWKKHGYVTRGRLPHYYPHGVDAFAMTKSLVGRKAMGSRGA